jgi:hypothetical protein
MRRGLFSAGKLEWPIVIEKFGRISQEAPQLPSMNTDETGGL